MKYLITNSDDFGMNESITDAILETHLNGIMTSTTLMVNMPGFDYAVKKAKENTTLGVGIHFNLTEGKPVSSPNLIPDLLDENGLFKINAIQRKNLLAGKEIYKQAYIELKAQLEKMFDSGIVPTHFDSHHHITGVPMAFKASVDVANEFNIEKARITNIDFRYANKYNGSILTKFKREVLNSPKAIVHKWNKSKLRSDGFKTPDTKILPTRVLPLQHDEVEQFIQALTMLKPGVTEISFHPGYMNSNPYDTVNTASLRIRDFNVATSKKVKDYLSENQIKLISFKDLR